MKVAFTICSNNYLAQASILAESFKKYNPNFYFAIVLVDENSSDVHYASIDADEIISIHHLSEYNLSRLFDIYNIIELNTAIKPFAFKYLVKKFFGLTSIYYFDPDIKIFSGLEELDEQLQNSSAALTPHIITPIPLDGMGPQESVFLNYGLYNLGFFGLNAKHPACMPLLDWWGERTYKLGYDDVANGLFVDQLWMNFIPLFFSDVLIIFNRGYNMGPWNLHERKIKSKDNDRIILNTDEVLNFYHFSSYSYQKPKLIGKYYDRYSFETEGILKEIYDEYYNDLLRMNVDKYSVISYAYGRKPSALLPTPPITFKQKVMNRIKAVFS